ncbi:MAG: universal stress protein [Candidatus Obscuribacterales bacterium]
MRFMVAFSSPKRSARTVEAAARQAKALGAEVVLLRVIPDAEKVGIVAQLIATDRPVEKAQEQINMVVGQLQGEGVKASGAVKVGEVGPGIVKAATEMEIDMLFVGTMNFQAKPRFLMARDPIVHYLVDHCPVNLVLIRQDEPSAAVIDAEEEGV